MTVLLLLLTVVLILLFGVSAVKGWLSSILGLAIGAFCLIALILISVHFFGEEGFLVLLGIGGGALIALKLWVDNADTEVVTPNEMPSMESAVDPDAIDRVWRWHEQAIADLFDDEARSKANELYEAQNAQALDRYCRRQARMLTRSKSES